MTARKKKPAVKRKVGRPTKYDPAKNDAVRSMCLLGATDEDLAAFLEVGITTLERWKSTNAVFRGVLKSGKEEADADVARSLYERAVKDDTTAAIFWLKNRRRDVWRDKQHLEHTGKDGERLNLRSLIGGGDDE